MEEVWKDIKDYEGYQVSNLGNVRTHNKITYTEQHGERKWKNRILKFKKCKNSRVSKYDRVDLWKDGKCKTFLVHRLVAETFIPNENNYPIINHIDENGHNNNVNNLEWCDYKYNNNYGKFEDKNHIYLKIGDKIIYFKNKSEASTYIGKTKSYISNAIYYNKRIFNSEGKEVFIA